MHHLRNDWKCKYIFMFFKIDSAGHGWKFFIVCVHSVICDVADILMVLYWNGNVVIWMMFSSLAAPEVVILTTSGAASDENFNQNDNISILLSLTMFCDQIKLLLSKETLKKTHPHCLVFTLCFLMPLHYEVSSNTMKTKFRPCLLYPLQNKFLGFTPSVRLSVHPSHIRCPLCNS